MQKIIITGADGRMGRALIEAVIDSEGVELAGAVVQTGAAVIGTDAGIMVGKPALGIVVNDDLNAQLSSDSTVIDFTAPSATLSYLPLIAKAQAQIIIGTTGFTEAELNELNRYGDSIKAVFAGNYSVGVNLTLQLLRTAAKIIGESSDIEIIEAHHKHKVDAPSGTALMMGEAVAGAMNSTVKEKGVFSREGITGAREAGTIGFSTIRGGDIVGEHSVLFCSEGERVEIAHKASSRQTFARGAVRAAKWLEQQSSNGIYNMEDVLGFRA